jgi:hypothetical protein
MDNSKPRVVQKTDYWDKFKDDLSEIYYLRGLLHSGDNSVLLSLADKENSLLVCKLIKISEIEDCSCVVFYEDFQKKFVGTFKMKNVNSGRRGPKGWRFYMTEAEMKTFKMAMRMYGQGKRK